MQWVSSPAERQYIAGKIFEGVRSGEGSVSHVGEIGQIRVPIRDVLRTRGLTGLQARAHQVQSARPGAETILLLDSAELARLKPFFVVRDKSEFRTQLILWSVLVFCAFWAVHIFWSVRGAGGPQYVLPSVLLLSGAGMTLMITLRDPVRDTLAFSTFAQGVAGGCLVLALASTFDYRRISGKLSYVFLIASFVLSAGLILFGSGPTGSDAKVNLLGFQPAEVIRVLIVFFLPDTLRNDGNSCARCVTNAKHSKTSRVGWRCRGLSTCCLCWAVWSYPSRSSFCRRTLDRRC